MICAATAPASLDGLQHSASSEHTRRPKPSPSVDSHQIVQVAVSYGVAKRARSSSAMNMSVEFAVFKIKLLFFMPTYLMPKKIALYAICLGLMHTSAWDVGHHVTAVFVTLPSYYRRRTILKPALSKGGGGCLARDSVGDVVSLRLTRSIELWMLYMLMRR